VKILGRVAGEYPAALAVLDKLFQGNSHPRGPECVNVVEIGSAERCAIAFHFGDLDNSSRDLLGMHEWEALDQHPAGSHGLRRS